MVAQQNPIRQHARIDFVASPSSCGFQTIGTAALDVDANDPQGNRARAAQFSAKGGPAIGLRTQTMMNVNGLKTAAKRVRHMQQNHRIDSAR
jgi:hypothetical protein